MSQSRNPTDTQALLQSMLQKLKLQSGREGQAYQHTPVTTTASSTWGQDGKGGGSNSSPTNGFKFPTNGIQSKKFGSSAAESTFGFKGGEIQQAGHGSEVDRGLVSFPTQKDNTDGDKGENSVLGQATQSGITPTVTGQLFPAKPLRDAVITSSERTDGERVSGSSAMTSHTQKQGFTAKVYTWSPKSADANPDKGGQVLHMGNGGFGALAQNKDMQIVTADQKTSNSSFRRKQQRPSENKTRRWTQKLKERWRDRPGSFGKKGKEEAGREEQKSGQATEISPQNQLLTAANKEEETTPLSLDSSNPSKTPEDGTNGGNLRSVSDFEFSLGSFSLLEEITTGQKWANFLNPNQSAASDSQRPSEELKISPDLHDSSQSSVILNHQGGVNNQWSFRSTEASPVWDYSMAQMSPEPFLPVNMDVSEGKQQQYVHREADQSEPMEHGHTQVAMQPGGSIQRRRPPSFVQPDDNSAPKSRLHLNRKRQHQSVEMRDERLQEDKIGDTKEAGREGFISSPSLSSNAMEEAGGSQHDGSILQSPSLSPAPKGVLKHSISQDSEASMEVVTKRRRVEENRRVRFSEEVVAIDPPELDPDATDSEKDSGSEEDSVIEQECEVEQAVIEEVSPARRPALPAWIQALKRRNTGKKHR